jgi:hypothetical protein
VKKVYLPLSAICLIATFLLFPVVKAGKHTDVVVLPVVTTTTVSEKDASIANLETVATTLYENLNLKSMGMSKSALLYAYKGQQKLQEAGATSSDILTVCDFSQPSNQKRMYIIDLKDGKVLLNTYVAHGKNSGVEYAERFSNRNESLQSSLGFYVTKGTYFGKHGLSLKLSGQEEGYNNNAESRAVVVHGANYIGDQRLGSAYMGRSFGCPAVPQQLANKVINLIKDGTTLFIYHPSQQYLHGSKLLNG